MTVKALSPNVSIAPQIEPKDVAALVDAHGFRSLICNRPDGEEDGQPAWAEVAAAGLEAGLETAHIPVTGQNFRPEVVQAFADALESMPKPVLCYCRTGTRSTILWALSNNGSLTAEERIRTGKRAGFDLEPWRSAMDDHD